MMKTKTPWRWLAAAAALGFSLGLGACVTGLTTQRTIVVPGVPDYFAYAGGGRDMTTVIVGNPFRVPKAVFEKAVTDAMQGHNNGPRANFTTRPADNARRNFRVVMLFNPPEEFDAYFSCESGVAAGETGARLRLIAAFCTNDELLSMVYGHIPAVESPDDPAFDHMIANVTRQLIPRVDPFSRGPNERISE